MFQAINQNGLETKHIFTSHWNALNVFVPFLLSFNCLKFLLDFVLDSEIPTTGQLTVIPINRHSFWSRPARFYHRSAVTAHAHAHTHAHARMHVNAHTCTRMHTGVDRWGTGGTRPPPHFSGRGDSIGIVPPPTFQFRKIARHIA